MALSHSIVIKKNISRIEISYFSLLNGIKSAAKKRLKDLLESLETILNSTLK